MQNNQLFKLFVGFGLLVGVAAVIAAAGFNKKAAEQLAHISGQVLNNSVAKKVGLADKTNTVLKTAKDYHLAEAVDKETKLNKLMSDLEVRKNTILAAIETDPQSVVGVLMTEKAKERFPDKAKFALEQEIDLEGTYLYGIGDDLENQIVTESHQFTSNGKTYQLYFAGEKPKFNANKLRVKGYAIDNKIIVPSDPGSVVVTGTAPLATGTKRVAVILANFIDDTRQPFTTTTIYNSMFNSANSVRAQFAEFSYNKLDVQGNVFGWYTLPVSGAGCDNVTWGNLAEQAASNAGVNLAEYTNVMVMWPSRSCGWGGWAYYISRNSYINNFTIPTAVHELAHNFNSMHSSSYRCTSGGVNVAISSSCTASEYGDVFDIMGLGYVSSTGYSRHENNYHKGYSWFTAPNTQTITSAGTYTLYPQQSSINNVIALRLAKDSYWYYYLEFRQPMGFDNFSSTDPVVNGVTVRMAPNYSTLTHSLLLDAGNPSTSTFADAPLLLNQTFTDPAAGISVKVVEVTSSYAKVEVTYPPIACVKSNPSISVSPTAQWAASGTALTYNITVKNNNNSGCSTTTYNVNPTLPAGFVQSPSNFSVNLNSGASSTTAVTITSTLGTPESVNQIVQTVVDGSSAAYSATTYLNYNVTLPDVVAPVVNITSPANNSKLPSKGSVNISANANDTSGIGKIELNIDGKVVKTCTAVTSCGYKWSMTKLASGTHTIKAVVWDKNNNMAEAVVTVTK